MKVELKGLKTYPRMSEETTAFTATVVVDGVVIGEAKNQGHGGSNFYHWTDREAGKRLEAYAQSLPTEFQFEKLDQFINDLMDQFEENKRLQRWVKAGKLAFRIENGKPGEWYTTQPMADTPENRARIAAGCKKPIAEWANDRFAAAGSPAGGSKSKTARA